MKRFRVTEEELKRIARAAILNTEISQAALCRRFKVGPETIAKAKLMFGHLFTPKHLHQKKQQLNLSCENLAEEFPPLSASSAD